MPLKVLKCFLMLIQQRVLPKTLKNNFIFTKKWDSEMKKLLCVFFKPIVIKNLLKIVYLMDILNQMIMCTTILSNQITKKDFLEKVTLTSAD